MQGGSGPSFPESFRRGRVAFPPLAGEPPCAPPQALRPTQRCPRLPLGTLFPFLSPLPNFSSLQSPLPALQLRPSPSLNPLRLSFPLSPSFSFFPPSTSPRSLRFPPFPLTPSRGLRERGSAGPPPAVPLHPAEHPAPRPAARLAREQPGRLSTPRGRARGHSGRGRAPPAAGARSCGQLLQSEGDLR